MAKDTSIFGSILVHMSLGDLKIKHHNKGTSEISTQYT